MICNLPFMTKRVGFSQGGLELRARQTNSILLPILVQLCVLVRLIAEEASARNQGCVPASILVLKGLAYLSNI